MFDTAYTYYAVGKRKGERSATVHLFKFNTKRNRQINVEVEMYDDRLAIIKFYDKAHRESRNRYNLLTRQGGQGGILRTCVNIMIYLYRQNTLLSFAFVGSPTIGEKKDTGAANTKRFRVYRGLMENFFSDLIFQHLVAPDSSFYMLLNREESARNPNTIVEVLALVKQEYPGEPIWRNVTVEMIKEL